MHPAIGEHRSGIAAICQRYGIQRLEVSVRLREPVTLTRLAAMPTFW
ncbi:MAG: hypothetical protein ACK4HJ_11855 [Acidovorax sp.]